MTQDALARLLALVDKPMSGQEYINAFPPDVVAALVRVAMETRVHSLPPPQCLCESCAPKVHKAVAALDAALAKGTP